MVIQLGLYRLGTQGLTFKGHHHHHNLEMQIQVGSCWVGIQELMFKRQLPHHHHAEVQIQVGLPLVITDLRAKHHRCRQHHLDLHCHRHLEMQIQDGFHQPGIVGCKEAFNTTTETVSRAQGIGAEIPGSVLSGVGTDSHQLVPECSR